jgi:hypothetical protein
MSKFLIVSLLLVLLPGCAVKELQERDQGDALMSLAAKAVKVSDQQWDLRVELVLHGNDTIRMMDTDLPWGFRDNLLLVPVVLDKERTKLQEVYYIDDPIGNLITVEPGDRLSGTIYLFNRFPDITKVTKEHDVLLFWSYELQPIDGPALPRASGAIVIPKQH